jgi:hypothetical protein
MLKTGKTTKKGLLLRTLDMPLGGDGSLLTPHPHNSRTKIHTNGNDLLQETAAVASAVKDVAEEIHEQKEEVLQVQLAELKIEREMLKSQIATANLSVRIFRITIFSTFIALLSLLIALLRV